MRILGIDPGLNTTGYGLIEGKGLIISLIEAGYIRTSPKDDDGQRLQHIYKGINKLIHKLKPEVMVLEKLYAHAQYPTTAYVLGHARGMICLAAKQNNIPLVEYPATRIKKAVTGKGHASKSQMQHMIQSILALKSLPKPADVSDALSISIAHSYMALRKI